MSKSFDPTKPVQFRNGTPARILATDLKGERPLAIAYELNGEESISRRNADGLFYGDESVSERDLVNVPVKTTKYMRLPFETAETAMLVNGIQMMKEQRQGYFEIHYEDGVPVSVTFHKE